MKQATGILPKNFWLYATVIELFILTILAGVGVFQYFAYQDNAKKQYSLDLVSEYYSEHASEHFTALDDAWETHFHDLLKARFSPSEEKLKDPAAEPPGDEAIYSSFVAFLVNQENLANNIKYIFDFHERLFTCVEDLELCDKKTIEKFFADEDARINASELWRRYYPYVCAYRKRWRPKAWSNMENYLAMKENIETNSCSGETIPLDKFLSPSSLSKV